jgi:hypothetical protein
VAAKTALEQVAVQMGQGHGTFLYARSQEFPPPSLTVAIQQFVFRASILVNQGGMGNGRNVHRSFIPYSHSPFDFKPACLYYELRATDYKPWSKQR